MIMGRLRQLLPTLTHDHETVRSEFLLAAARGWSTFAGLRIEYSLVQRDFIFGGMSDRLDLPPGRSRHG